MPGTDADQPMPEAAPVSVEVDLVSTGITAAVDAPVRTAPAAVRWTPVLAVRDEALTVVHTGDRRRGLRTAVIAAVLTVALVVALILLGTAVRADPDVPAGPVGTSGTTR